MLTATKGIFDPLPPGLPPLYEHELNSRDRTFSVATHQVWNNFLPSLQLVDSNADFCRCLKTSVLAGI